MIRPRVLWAGLIALAGLVGTTACNQTDAAVSRVTTTELQERLVSERGHPVLLVFWATWCKPCVEEMPDLATLHRESESGLQVLSVSLDAFLSGEEQSVEIVRQFLVEVPAPYTNVVYTGSQDEIFAAFELPGGIPYSILYDAQGTILHRFLGRVSPSQVRRLLAAGST